MPGLIKPLWILEDGRTAEFEVETTTGTAVLRLPLNSLVKVKNMLARVEGLAARKLSGRYLPPAIPVTSWNLTCDKAGEIHLNLYEPGGGGHGFHLSRSMMTAIGDALQEAAGQGVKRSRKPN